MNDDAIEILILGTLFSSFESSHSRCHSFLDDDARRDTINIEIGASGARRNI